MAKFIRRIIQRNTRTRRALPQQRHSAKNANEAQFSNALRQYQLQVTPPNDRYETEADHMAQQVAHMPETQVQQSPVMEDRAAGLAQQVTPLIQRQEAGSEEEEAIQTRAIQRQEAGGEEEEETVQTRAIQRQEAGGEEEEETVQTRAIQRQEAGDEEEETVQMSGRGRSITPEVEERMGHHIEQGGRPLSLTERDFFEPRFGADFEGVRIHDDAESAQIARDLNAHAFTQGEHIFFGAGQYQPHDTPGRELMAHELTHTIQQGAVAAESTQAYANGPSPTVQRQPSGSTRPAVGGPAPPAVTTSDRPRLNIPQPLVIPEFKATGHMGALYSQRRNQLYRAAGYNSTTAHRRARQADIWERQVYSASRSAVEGALRRDFNMLPNDIYYVRVRRDKAPGLSDGLRQNLSRLGKPRQIAMGMVRPFWNRQGEYEMYHVDHVVELGVSGYWQESWPGSLENLQLLSAHANLSSGSHHGHEVNRQIASIAHHHAGLLPGITPGTPERQVINHIKANYDVYFNGYQGDAGRNPPRGHDFWQRSDIQDGAHMPAIRAGGSKTNWIYEFYDWRDPARDDSVFSPHPMGDAEFDAEQEAIAGSSQRFVTYHRAYGGRRGHFWWGERNQGHISRPGTVSQNIQQRDHAQIPGMHIREIAFDPHGGSPRLGHLVVNPFYTSGRGRSRSRSTRNIYAIDPITVRVMRIGSGILFAGYLNPDDYENISATIAGLSPVVFDRVYIDEEQGLTAIGRINPTIPLLRDQPIDIVFTADDVRAQRTFSADAFSLPGPINVSRSDLTVSLGLNSGLGISGRMDFQIERVGEGHLTGSAQTGRPGGQAAGFELGGEFNFDTELFRPATINMWYRDGQFGARGTIGIPSGRVRGIRSATFTVGYENDTITATGTAQFAAPGIQQGSLSLTYSATEGLTIGGAVQLGRVPGLRGGSLDAEVQRRPDGTYKIHAAGTAQPSIPGVNAQVRLSYDDGIFDANVTANYQRGMMTGQVTIGATNRPVDENNRPSGEPEDIVRAYGGGQVTVRIAPWLQGTVGIRLLPNGEMELTGEIGLPDTVEIFRRYAIERNIFNLNLDIPIVGVAVAGQRIGIFATIGGGLDVSAGIGPGQIQEMRLGIQYNPDREQDTHVYGRGQLQIPADAGLRLFVRGGLGAGIPIVSATAGLEVSGQLGIEGAIEADVNVDWTPRTGLEIRASGSIFAEPTLRLSVDAYVDVSADLLFTTVDLYNERWNLAGVDYGSGLRLGMTFPIHYQEGQPFNIALDDVQFTVPDINVRNMISDVLRDN